MSLKGKRVKQYYFLISVSLIVLLLFSFFVVPDWMSKRGCVDNFFVGVTFSGDSVLNAKLLIDRVKDFTNLLVVQSGPASKNETMLNEICNYAVNAGLSIIVYFGKFDRAWQPLWLDSAKEKWDSSFLGVYFFDEPAGSLLDSFMEMWNESSSEHQLNLPENYDEIAEFFVHSWETMPGLATVKERAVSLAAFTSDYALYWFDYLAGYDVVLAQFGWNHTLAQDIALIRGAARLQNKSWGAIITWKYNKPPYLDSGLEIYNQMRTAYEAGAEYIVIFNYAEDMGVAYGTLQDEHFVALKRFWNDVVQSSAVRHSSVKAETVLVLPKNYGWGMRHLDDKIWGLWDADEKSEQIWKLLNHLIREYGLTLDIVYDDPAYPIINNYKQIYYWNQTI
jgi:hypothetical protein